MIAADILHFEGKCTLVTIDIYSGYITYDPLQSEQTIDVTNALINNFQKFGLVQTIFSDNGPCFRSKFKEFCVKFDIEHDTSSPYYHKAMGQVERANQEVAEEIKDS